MRTQPGASSVFDGDFPQRFVQFVVDQQDVFMLDAIFTRFKKRKKTQKTDTWYSEWNQFHPITIKNGQILHV